MVRAFGIALILGGAFSISADSRVPTPLAVAIGPATRLLLLSPHPDDETLAAAGLIRRVVKAGGTVRVVLLTSGDAFAEGVETSDGIVNPTSNDYRHYGTMRESESIDALTSLGVNRKLITFLGFPDDGLCQLASRYLTARRRSFESPYTDRVSPPLTEQVIRGVRYRGVDIRRELERIVREFGPTLLALPHPEDDHPDHCSTHIFGRDVMDALVKQRHAPKVRVLHYLIHYEQWPLSGDAGGGSELSPPADFPRSEGRWVSLTLTPDEAIAKKQALLAYPSQLLVIGRFMLAFGRDNELFLEGEPAYTPECWCNDGADVATDLPPWKYRKRPPQRP
jgi:LmbE family N-acetylglucosaminyl deacetylase